MTTNFLWISLVFFIIASILPQKFKLQRMPVGAVGWFFFAVYWALQPLYYIKEGDISMVLLMLLVALFCLIIAHLMISTYSMSKKGMPQDNPVDRPKTLLTVTTITAIGCLFYLPFAEIESMNHLIIKTVTTQTFWLSQQVGFPVERVDWNMIKLGIYRVEIILACTAIESMALFFGLILGTRAGAKKVFLAMMASIPVIYILNVIRNTFVIGAYGYEWFGSGPMIVNLLGKEYFLHDSASFYISHHLIAKGGSGIALFFIAYVVLKTLPELLDLIDNLWQLVKDDLNHIRGG
ncbi:MAG: archaeosortase A [Methanosarcinales archaeon]|nr:archaeosortase A [Methanosarcinales archaeon]